MVETEVERKQTLKGFFVDDAGPSQGIDVGQQREGKRCCKTELRRKVG